MRDKLGFNPLANIDFNTLKTVFINGETFDKNDDMNRLRFHSSIKCTTQEQLNEFVEDCLDASEKKKLTKLDYKNRDKLPIDEYLEMLNIISHFYHLRVQSK